MKGNNTKDWDLYCNGKNYNNKLKPNYYSTVDTNLEFYNGNQWRNVQANGMPTPVFNIIKRSINFFVASLTSNKVKVQYEPLAYSEDDEGNPTDPSMMEGKDASDIATAEVENLFNKFKMDNRIRDALTDAAVMGDIAAHIYFDATKKPYGGAFGGLKGEICLELVDGSSIFFGNANNGSVEAQPYIIIQGRDMIKNLQEEAKAFKSKDTITSDNDTQNMSGDMGKVEIDAIEGDEYGKATYIIIYKKDKKTGTIKVSKSTQDTYIYQDIDTELTNYPVAWLRWENQKNQYHGRAVCTGIIPNQIFINRMFAMVMYHLMMAAFPKAVYDADRVGAWSNEIGAAIPLKNMMPGDNIKNVAGYLEPGNMSSQIVQVIDLAINYTKETLGINDAMTGNVDPSAASGKSIVATQEAGKIPLENINAAKNEWVGDIGRILLDMMGTYYGERDIVITQNNQKQIVRYDFDKLKNLWLNVATEIGAASYWSELASVQTLDNLLQQGLIDIVDYLESIPDGYVNKKQELIDKVKARQQQAQQAQQQADMQAQQGQEAQMQEQDAQAQQEQQGKEQQMEQMAQWLESQAPELQQQIMQLPPDQQEQTIIKLMQEGIKNTAQGGV